MLSAAAMVWGGMFPAVKPLMAGMDPFILTLARYGLAAPIFLALLWAVEGRSALTTAGRTLRLWWLGTVGFAGFGLFIFVGLGMTQPEHASVVPATIPLISAAVVALRQRAWPGPQVLASGALGLAGVMLVVTGGNLGALVTGGAGRGEALVFAGATCWVVYTLGAAGFAGWSGLRYTALTCAFGTLTIAVVEAAALSAGAATLPSLATLGAAAPGLTYMVLAASVVAVLGWNAGIRALGPARGVLFINLVPVTAMAVAIVGGRVPASYEIAGVALVIAALVLSSLSLVPQMPALTRA
jgi:drug/metabolite transporter (DMT)-like permease